MNSTGLAAHEQLELHEIIRSEIIASRKIQASLAMVTDENLKSFMATALQMKQEILKGYQSFYKGQVQQCKE